ncbi:MAG: transposase [Candidatus Bathyarchaeia archaeon]
MGFHQAPIAPKAGTGRPRADDRHTMNGILYGLVTGCRWMDMPIRYGSYATAWRRLKRWRREGVWARVLEALMAKGCYEGKLGLDKAAVDSSTLKAGKWGS